MILLVMKQNELKKILKPLIKQCIKEVIFDDGVLSGIISEVVKGTNNNIVIQEKESHQQKEQIILQERKKFEEKNRIKLQETKKKMLDAIGRDSLNGADIFENTEPISNAGPPGETDVASPLQQYAPSDAGVDISSMFNPKWKEMV